jgi:hypothetical protein
MRTIALALCSLTTFWFAGAQKCTPADHNEWLAHAISEVETIHPGMTRAELLKMFEPAGGFFSGDRLQGAYVYRNSVYIRIDVRFAAQSDKGVDVSVDVITSVGRPYLAFPVYD